MKQTKENRKRADKIGATVEVYAYDGVLQHPETGAAGITDILSDLRHYCDRHGLDFGELDQIAYGHYAAELKP